MMRFVKFILAAAAVSALFGSGAHWSAEAATNTVKLSENEKVVLETGPRQTIALNSDVLHTGGAEGAAVPVQVVLERHLHEYVVTPKPTTSGATVRRDTIYQYELRATSGSDRYSWSCWHTIPLTGFRLFSHGYGRNYLAWVDTSRVYIAEVSRGVDAITALKRVFGPKRSDARWAEFVPVGDLAGSRPFLSHDALHSDIRIQSVYEDKKGRLTVEVKGSQSDKVFKFVREKADPAEMSKLPKWQRSEWSWRLVE